MKPTQPTREQVQELITAWDVKYRRVNLNDVAPMGVLTSKEVMEAIKTQIIKRPKGRYELVCTDMPDPADIEMPGLDDSEIGAAHDLFDRLVAEIAPNVLWVIHEGYDRYDIENMGLVFTEDLIALDDERADIQHLLIDSLSHYHETLRDEHDSLEQAMGAFDADPSVRVLKKISVSHYESLRKSTEEELKDYLD